MSLNLRTFGAIILAIVTVVVNVRLEEPSGAAEPSGGTKTSRRLAVGVSYQGMWSDWTDIERIEVLDRLMTSRIKWLRLEIAWCSLEPFGPEHYNDETFRRLDLIVEEALLRGFKIMGTLWCTPEWAAQPVSEGERVSSSPPEDPSDFGRIAHLLAKRYRGRVSAWEVRNEPNLRSFWTGSIEDYLLTLEAGSKGFRQGDHSARIVLGGLSGADPEWLDALYELGGGSLFDIVALHLYSNPGDLPPGKLTFVQNKWWGLHSVRFIRRIMRKYGDRDKNIWLTEFGWSTHENEIDMPGWMRGVTEEQQRRFLLRTLNILKDRYFYIKKIFWYTARNRDIGNIHSDNFGLLRRNLDPKPAFRVLQARDATLRF